MKKVIYCFVIFFFAHVRVSGQIQGISASKLTTINSIPVPKGMLEFEPAFSYVWSDKYWNSEREKVPSFENGDSIKKTSELGFRISYGLSKILEAGVYLPADLSALSIGTKIHVYSTEKLGLAFLSGG
ncbi:MAG: hypothetical protein JXJ22_12070 [Bacteroidales bacterium]|nr:hypothetical protein [Bacteroidales bacterium]